MAESITNVLGVVGMKTRGAYNSETSYEKLNVVTYQGSSYCAKTSTQGNLPTNETYWDLIAEKGDKGDTGDDGYTPQKGTDYFTEADKSEIESDLQPTIASNVQSEVITQVGNISNGTPLKANSISDMTDTTRLYVNTSDGYVYYYNGTDWVRGWLYQSSEDSDTVDMLVDVAEKSVIISKNLIEPLNCINNKAISGSTGAISDNNSYWISQHIPVNNSLEEATISLSYNNQTYNAYKCAFYNSDGFVSADGNANHIYTAPNTATYCILQFKQSWIPYTDADKIMVNYGSEALPFKPFGDVSLNLNIINENTLNGNKILNNSISDDKIKSKTYNYLGNKISLSNKLDSVRAYNWTLSTPEGAPNSCAIYGDLLFHIGSHSGVRVFDLSTEPWTQIADFYLNNDINTAPHCNVAFFGHKYNENDEFPILYVNAYNTTGLPLGTLYGYRITRSSNTFTAELVQTITIGFTNNEIWTDGNDIRPYGNFVLDTDTDTLYAYTLKDADKITRFFGFTMPSLTNSNVTLNTSDIITQFDIPYIAVIQDNLYDNGNIYIASGISNNGYIIVVSLLSQKIVSKINLSNIGFTYEPEIIGKYKDKILQGNGLVYWLTF